MQIGDIVARKSYNCDIWFEVISVNKDNIMLKGIEYRLIADAHYNDLQKINTRGKSDSQYNSSTTNLFKNWYMNQTNFKYNDDNKEVYANTTYKKYGKILHIDGDKSYLNECLIKYEKLGVSAIGISIEENKQPEVILELLQKHKPNILVITGHDSIVRNSNYIYDIDQYQNSKYYVKSIEIARQYESSYDNLVIFAGGCKSYYEYLMQAGANFATSPNRILVHVIDPVLVACKIATTSIREVLDIDTIVKDTSVGINGIGGIETRGQCREYKPKF